MANQELIPAQAIKNIAETALEAGKQLALKPILSPIDEGVPFIILRDSDGNEKTYSIFDRFPVPHRKKGLVKLFDEASFVKFWDRHNSPESTIFSAPTHDKLTAIFNDHGENTELPGWRDHRAEYSILKSTEWLSWTKKDREAFNGNVEFAEFVENMLPDFIEPAGASMLELVLNLKITANASYSKAVRLSDGDTQFTYTNSVDGAGQSSTGQIKIPDQFIISIPVFYGADSPKYKVAARFRYRLNNANLKIWFELIRPTTVLDEAFAHIVSRISENTGHDIYSGLPE